RRICAQRRAAVSDLFCRSGSERSPEDCLGLLSRVDESLMWPAFSGAGLFREQAQEPHDDRREERHSADQAGSVKEGLQERRFARVVGRLFQEVQWIPFDASHRSASMAALQPSPAAETACRYVGSATSPAAKTPSTEV